MGLEKIPIFHLPHIGAGTKNSEAPSEASCESLYLAFSLREGSGNHRELESLAGGLALNYDICRGSERTVKKKSPM